MRAGNYYFTTAPLPSQSLFQNSVINLPYTEPGYIRVHYPSENFNPSDFLLDEQKLLDMVALEISHYIEKFQILERKASLRRTLEHMDRLAILSETIAGIAHELNNPLANILGYAELIKITNTNSEIDSDITTIIDTVIYTREIVKKLMFFSCEMPYQPKLQDINPIITFALSILKQNFHKKEIKSEVHFNNKISTAIIDSVQLTQLVFNILKNAIQASPQKSTIKTIIENDEKNIIIKIEDQGHGIPEEIKQQIFEPFFTTKKIKNGAGLGLSVVHGIIKNHNGEITVINNYPSGSIFIISLPINQ
ncbi:sensor histidine kinase [Flavobacterium sp. KACC 22761]|uniref:sensor histidine kinase n=1 Tax=Flavobacterium sp. KACC 22761 TaxID=3092665 RepID=UPI002A7567C6|nr:ATP-binding protein [Flavobacterium sp. KACC 22761]WPO78470.1 ATP-binding protein [Flavobacterium sp. KACC 22761]